MGGNIDPIPFLGLMLTNSALSVVPVNNWLLFDVINQLKSLTCNVFYPFFSIERNETLCVYTP